MIILSKLADYGVIITTHLAQVAPGQVNAVHLADETRLPRATVSKVLKLLARAGIATAVRGAAGGYRLARPAQAISVADVIAAIDGNPAVTQCTSHEEHCTRLDFCTTKVHWSRINQAVERALDEISISAMVSPPSPFLEFAPKLENVSP